MTQEQPFTMSTKDAMLQTILCGYHFLIWYAVDLFFLFGLPRLYERLVEGDNGSYEAGVMLAFIIYLFMILFAGGHTPGMLVANVRFAYLHTYKTLVFMDYIGYMIESYWESWKYNGLYQILELWGNPLHQTPAMEQVGLIIVRKHRYKAFRKQYSKHGIILTIDQNATKRTPQAPIFTDRDS